MVHILKSLFAVRTPHTVFTFVFMLLCYECCVYGISVNAIKTQLKQTLTEDCTSTCFNVQLLYLRSSVNIVCQHICKL